MKVVGFSSLEWLLSGLFLYSPSRGQGEEERETARGPFHSLSELRILYL